MSVSIASLALEGFLVWPVMTPLPITETETDSSICSSKETTDVIENVDRAKELLFSRSSNSIE